MLRAVTFDLWGTLVDAKHNLVPQRLQYLAQLIPGCPLTQLEEAYQKADTQFGAVTNLGFPYSTATLLSLTLDALGTSLPPSIFEQALRHWKEILLLDPPPLLDAVPEVLSTLHSRGLRLALISDTGLTPGYVIRRVLTDYGLTRYLEQLTFSDAMGVTKRRAQIYLTTLQALAVRADETLHVGDSPTTDILGAQAAGLRGALLLQNNPQPAGIPHADLVLNHIRELPEAVRDW
jgi:putative hydrolase of the HAD superfamily